MTTKTRISFAPEDLQAIKMVCKNCRNETGWNRGQRKGRIPRECPWCGAEWDHPGPSETWNWLTQFFSMTTNPATFENKPFYLEFELNAKDKEAS